MIELALYSFELTASLSDGRLCIQLLDVVLEMQARTESMCICFKAHICKGAVHRIGGMEQDVMLGECYTTLPIAFEQPE